MADATFQIEVGVTQNGVAVAAQQVGQFSSAAEAAAARADALSAATSRQATALSDAERAANAAATAVERSSLKMADAQARLAKASDAGDVAGRARAIAAVDALARRHERLVAAAATTSGRLAEEAAKLDALSAASSGAADEVKKLADAEDEVADTAGGAGIQANEAAEGLGKLGGPLGVVGQRALGTVEGLKKLTTSLGGAGGYVAIAVALVALASGIALVAAAAAKAAIEVGIWAVKLADAKRSNDALLAGMVGSQAEGIALGNVIGMLSDELGTSTEELQRMASDLAKSGLRGRDLHEALEDAAVSAAQLKYGDDFKNGARSINAQVERLKRNLDRVFGGLKIEALLRKFQELGDLFDENSASAQAIKVVFESLFQPLVDGVVGLIPKVRTAFIQFEILALKALIAIKPYGSTIMTVVQVVLVLSAVILGALAVAVGFIIANLAIIGAGAGLVIAAIGGLVAGVVWLGVKLFELGVQGIDWLRGKFDSIREFLAGFNLAELGTQMIEGLVNGIKSAAGGVIGSVTDVVSGGIDAAKKALGIASPSKVFAEIGMNTAAGMTEGVSDGGAETKGAIESLVAPPSSSPGAPPLSSTSSGASGTSGASVSLQGVTFNINGVAGASDAVKQLQALLTSIIEGDLAALGGATNA